MRSLIPLLIAHRARVFIAILFFTNACSLVSLFRSNQQLDTSPVDVGGASPGRRTNLASFRFSNITQRTFFRGHGLQGFVFFSAYRMSPSEFVVLGLSPLILHRVLESRFCWWWPGGGGGEALLGHVEIEYPGEAHQKTYEVTVLFCTLKGGTRAGEGGHLTVLIDKEELIVYGEPRGNTLPLQAAPPYKSNITYCSQPIYGNFNEQRVIEWVEYHRIGHGVDRFHLYDVGRVADSLLMALRPYIGKDVMTLTDISEVQQYENWYAQVLVMNDCVYPLQVLAMNDCVYRSRFESRWLLFLDLDEYLYVSKPLGNLLQVLQSNEGQAWVSFGSEFFFTKMCSHSMNVTLPRNASQLVQMATTRWEVEKMIFKQAEVHCVALDKYPSRFLCLGYDGHRKYVADPRRIVIAGIHSVTKPRTGGLDLDARDIHLNHYRGLNTNFIKSCSQYIQDTDWIPKSWLRDFSLSRSALEVRYLALRDFLSRRKGSFPLVFNASGATEATTKPVQS